jgi:hypothetical protein
MRSPVGVSVDAVSKYWKVPAAAGTFQLRDH